MPTSTIQAELAEYAESPDAFSVWPADFERVLTDRYCAVIGPTPHFTSVQRLRLGREVEDGVHEIRALLSARGRANAVWWLGESATPKDLPDRLLELGFREPQDRVTRLTAMALVREPEAARADVEVRRVETLEDFTAAREVMWSAFETPEERRAPERAYLERGFRTEHEQGVTVTFLALLDALPVGAGRAAFCSRGGLLFAGGTIPEARGRGAYRALVRARWDEAVRRGTPALVTQAAPSSEPILRCLGFQEACRILRLEDPT